MTPKSLAPSTWGTVLLPSTKFTCGIILCLPKYNTLHLLYDILSCHLSLIYSNGLTGCQTIAVDHLDYSANHYNQVHYQRLSKLDTISIAFTYTASSKNVCDIVYIKQE